MCKCVCPCVLKLGVGGVNDEEKRGELSTPSSTTNRNFWTLSSSMEQENAERKNLYCSYILSAAVKGFGVDHFLFNGSFSLSLSLTLSCYQSISARRIHTTREKRKFVVEPFVRLSVHLSTLYCLSSVTLLLCMRSYVRVYILSLHLLSLSVSLLCVCVCTSIYSYWWPKGCSEVNFALARSFCIHCSFSDTM